MNNKTCDALDVATLSENCEILRNCDTPSLLVTFYSQTNPLSPLRRVHLPPEVLTEIFHFVKPVVDTDVERSIW